MLLLKDSCISDIIHQLLLSEVEAAFQGCKIASAHEQCDVEEEV